MSGIYVGVGLIGWSLLCLLGYHCMDQTDIMTIILRLIYKKYSFQYWPIKSSIDQFPKVLNVAFPDEQIVYYVNSFYSDDNATLSGMMPPNIYFWSLTIYDEEGKPVGQICDNAFSSKNFKVNLNKKNKNQFSGETYFMKSPEKGVYCVIQRVYVSEEKPDPVGFLPKIEGLQRQLKNVSEEERAKNSNEIEDLLYKAFKRKIGDKIPTQLFPTVNVNQFFLPSKKQVSMAFPNPYALYLMAFPKTAGNVMMVKGQLPEASFENRYGFRFVSFMASNMQISATDDSLFLEDIKTDAGKNYVLFVAYSEEDARAKGYNASEHNLLLWDKTTTYPVLVYRLVSTEKTPTGVFAINNPDLPVDGKDLKPIMGEEYPRVELC